MLASPGADTLVKTMAEFIEPMIGGKLKYSPETMFTVDGIPARRLSGGQGVIFDAALRVAAAKTSNFPLIAIDDSRPIPESVRGRLMEFLLESGVQCILVQTAEKPSKHWTDLDGVAAYWLENPSVTGPTKITKIGAAKEAVSA
jgi:hypothetical protein